MEPRQMSRIKALLLQLVMLDQNLLDIISCAKAGKYVQIIPANQYVYSYECAPMSNVSISEVQFHTIILFDLNFLNVLSSLFQVQSISCRL